MRAIWLLLFFVAACIATPQTGRRGPPPTTEATTESVTDDGTDDTTDENGDSAVSIRYPN